MMQLHPWSPADFVFMFVVWAIMMVGMMLPTLIAGALCTALAAGVVAVFLGLDSTQRQQFFLRLALFRKVIPV